MEITAHYPLNETGTWTMQKQTGQIPLTDSDILFYATKLKTGTDRMTAQLNATHDGQEAVVLRDTIWHTIVEIERMLDLIAPERAPPPGKSVVAFTPTLVMRRALLFWALERRTALFPTRT